MVDLLFLGWSILIEIDSLIKKIIYCRWLGVAGVRGIDLHCIFVICVGVFGSFGGLLVGVVWWLGAVGCGWLGVVFSWVGERSGGRGHAVCFEESSVVSGESVDNGG